MLDRLIQWSLNNHILVMALSVLLLIAGAYVIREMPVDVFPDLTAPTVTIMTEAPGLATEEVEQQVNFPIETAINGATHIRRVRSLAVPGFSIVWAEFEWGTEIFQARQIVTERLSQVTGSLPQQANAPVLGPVSSIMGEIEFFGVSVKNPGDLMAAREFVDWQLRPQLLAIPGIAQITPLGGEMRQYQVLVSPDRLRELNVGLNDVRDAVARANRNAGGGWISEGGRDYLIRFIGTVQSLDDLRNSVVSVRDGIPLRVRDVATVEQGAAFAVGNAGINGKPGVMVAVLKQPQADTLQLTEHISRVLESARAQLPSGIEIEPALFRQADFIETAVNNVADALRDGALFVVVVLFIFLFSVQATLISTLAIPLSLVMAAILLWMLGIGINTMTLGGMTIAIGALVDDAIIFVENIYRRLKENITRTTPLPVNQVVFQACSEVRQPAVFSTLIIMLVFAPLFVLSGVEGRLLEPLGLSYLLAVGASLLVALTVTPVLSAWLLPKTKMVAQSEDTPVIRWCKRVYEPMLNTSLVHAKTILVVSLILVLGTLAAITQMGRSFFPEFNEGSLTITAMTPPGTSLETATDLGQHIEGILLALPEVKQVGRKTGRAEEDEHTQGPNMSEFEVSLGSLPQGKNVFLEELRTTLNEVRGVSFNIGQPLSHRIDHMLSGTRASIAVKVFGPSLAELESLGNRIERIVQTVDGMVDVSSEPLQAVPQLRLRADREAMARYGVSAEELADLIDTAYRGAAVSQVLEGSRRFDLVVRLNDEAREDRHRIGELPVRTPTGDLVPLRYLATPSFEYGPGTVLRENSERRLIISSNVAGRDLRSAVNDIRAAIDRDITLPSGYRVEYGGQFEAEEAATRTILWVSLGVLAGTLLLLQLAFKSLRLAMMILANIPFALVGGVAAVFMMGGTLTVAALVGFITLFGIAVRNGILLVSRYQALEAEGIDAEQAVRLGSEERLVPILMTALTAGLALVPLAFGLGQPGTEIQAPMAIVILGGLLTSTLLNMIVVPALYHLIARYSAKST